MIGLIAFISCNKEKNVKGNGVIVSENRTLEGFDKIELSGSADVFISQGSDYLVRVETDENILPLVETKVQGSELEIGLKKNTSIRKTSGINVYVTMPSLLSVEVSGAGNISSNDTFTSGSFDIEVSGSGDLYFQNIITNDFTLDISGSGDVEVSSAETTSTQDIRISGSGDLNLVDMPTTDSKVKISGSGNAKLNVINSLDVEISGSGDVRYMGYPTVNTDITGSGDVRPF